MSDNSDMLSNPEITELDDQKKVVDKIEVTQTFLKNIKAIMDVVNQRVHWKSDELYPIGTVLNELDGYLK